VLKIKNKAFIISAIIIVIAIVFCNGSSCQDTFSKYLSYFKPPLFTYLYFHGLTIKIIIDA
jgi:hypothetical protein